MNDSKKQPLYESIQNVCLINPNKVRVEHHSLDVLILDSSGITRSFDFIKEFYKRKKKVYTTKDVVEETLVEYRFRNKEEYVEQKRFLDLLVKDNKVKETMKGEFPLYDDEEELISKIALLTPKLVFFKTLYYNYFEKANEILSEVYNDYDINERMTFQSFITYTLRERRLDFVSEKHYEGLVGLKKDILKKSSLYLEHELRTLAEKGIFLDNLKETISDRSIRNNLNRMLSEMLIGINKKQSKKASKQFLYDKYVSTLDNDIKLVLLSYAYPLNIQKSSKVGIISADRDLKDLVKFRKRIKIF